MWIGCSDSRVPANQITGLEPGEVFVHRNVANVVVHSDLNALSAIQFAVEHLKVRHIMVVSHYACGGVAAALANARVGLADNWIRHVQDVRDRHRDMLGRICEQRQPDALSELNVVEQVANVATSTVLRDAWLRRQDVTIHGWRSGCRTASCRISEWTSAAARRCRSATTLRSHASAANMLPARTERRQACQAGTGKSSGVSLTRLTRLVNEINAIASSASTI